jgi:transposase
MRMNPHLRFMQDNAPGHTAGITREDLRERGIYPIFWPAFSPDLNPIETI